MMTFGWILRCLQIEDACGSDRMHPNQNHDKRRSMKVQSLIAFLAVALGTAMSNLASAQGVQIRNRFHPRRAFE